MNRKRVEGRIDGSTREGFLNSRAATSLCLLVVTLFSASLIS